MSKPERIALFGFVLLMLLSGFAGISYEVLYGRILGNLIGDQFAVSASVLITFLLGIGVGSLHAHRLWRFLWAIEAAIGLFGLLFAFSGSWLNTAIYALTPLFPGGLEGNLLISVILLSGPAFLIGCSVPLFSGYLSGLMPEAAFSRVYAVYNFGAFITALLIEFVMIRAFGIRGAVLCFAAINGVVALWLRVGFFRVRPKATEGVLHIEWPHWWGLVLASIASALFQLFMVKFAELVLGPFRESFALVLSLVLLGIAVGSLLVRRFRFSFTTLMLANLVGLLWLLVAVKLGIYLYAALYGLSAHNYFYSVLLKWFFLAGLMGVPAITFGATVPAILVRERDVSRESGALLFASSMANVAGFLLMAFVLHRYLDYGVQLLVIGMVSVLAVAVYARFRPRVLAAAAVIAVSMVGVYHYRWDEDLLYLSYTNFRSLDDLREARASFDFPERFRGYQDVFSINWMHGSPFFFINGYISIPLNNPSEKVVGALSSMFAPRADDALVLGLGSGATASTVGLVFDQTNVVEINPVVRQNLYRMRRWNYDIEHNPNVDIVVDDAIHYTKSSNKSYSLILNTVTTPLYFSSSKLYTRDFLDLVHRRLRPDGVYVTWMDSRIGDRGADIILNTIRQSFRHCAILYIKSAYFLLVCSDRPISPQQAAVVAGNPTIRADLMKRYGILADWLPYQLMDTDVFSLIGDRHVPVNEMNHPSLEFEMSRLHEKGIWGFKKRLLDRLNLQTIRRATGAGNGFPASLVMQAEKRMGASSITRRWKALVQHVADYPEQRDHAKLAYRRAQADILDTADAHHRYGYQLIRAGRYKAAIQEFDRALVENPKHDNTNFNIGACYEYMKQYDKALVYFSREAEIDPEDEDVPYRMGKIQVHLKRFKVALKELERAIGMRRRPGWRLYYYRGLAQEGLGKRKAAAADFRRALQMNGEKENVWRALHRVQVSGDIVQATS